MLLPLPLPLDGWRLFCAYGLVREPTIVTIYVYVMNRVLSLYVPPYICYPQAEGGVAFHFLGSATQQTQ